MDDYGDDYGATYDVDDYDETAESDKRDYDDYLKSDESEGSGMSSSNWVNLVRCSHLNNWLLESFSTYSIKLVELIVMTRWFDNYSMQLIFDDFSWLQ